MTESRQTCFKVEIHIFFHLKVVPHIRSVHHVIVPLVLKVVVQSTEVIDTVS